MSDTVSALPLVTIGIPSYNSARFIESTVRSALDQTYPNIEVLIIDDNSPDGTMAVLERIRDPRIRLLSNPSNLGAVGNWDRVLREARGEYVKLLHSDDLIVPDAVQTEVAGMLSDARLVMAASRRRIIDQTGRHIATRGAKWTGGRIEGREAVRSMVRTGTNLIGEPSAVLIRAQTFHEVGGFDESAGYAVDMELWSRLLSRGDLFFVPRPLAAFRVSGGQWSVRLAAEQARDVDRLLTRLGDDPGLGLSERDVRRGARSARWQARARRLLYSLVSLVTPKTPRPGDE